MEAYCSRCQLAVALPDDPTAGAGLCPTCGGQVTTAQPTRVEPVDGVALTFPATSNVAEPFVPFMKSSSLSGPEAGAATGEVSVEVDMDTSAATGADDGTVPASAMPPLSFDFGAPPTVTPSTEDVPQGEPSAAPDVEATDVPMEMTMDSVEAEPVAAPAGEPAVPAHLALPSFDFSVPSFDTSDMGGGSTAGSAAMSPTPAAASAPTGDVPAHMQMPSFPQFDFGLPPVPGAEPATAGVPAAADAGPAHLMPPTMPVGTPPPRPPGPPPRRPTGGMPPMGAAHAQAQPLTAMPSLPALPGLPAFGSAPPEKKEVTLLGSEQAQELAREVEKRSLIGTVIIGSVVVILLAAVGVVAFGFTQGWDKVVALVAPQRAADADLDPKVKAQAEAKGKVVEGMKAYDQKKFNVAVTLYKSALEIDPTLAEAHRNLGIVLATQKKQADAVDHYKTYLELSPKAPDAEELKKIIDEYEKTQKKPEPEKPKDEGKDDGGSKPKKKPKKPGTVDDLFK